MQHELAVVSHTPNFTARLISQYRAAGPFRIVTAIVTVTSAACASVTSSACALVWVIGRVVGAGRTTETTLVSYATFASIGACAEIARGLRICRSLCCRADLIRIACLGLSGAAETDTDTEIAANNAWARLRNAKSFGRHIRAGRKVGHRFGVKALVRIKRIQ